jgi:hypothetical protein
MAPENSTNFGSMASPVPLDMIKSWLRGEYLVGQNESTGYDYLGWALMLRGAYMYTVQHEGEKRTANWGVCTIDLKDGDLIYQGIQLGITKSFLTKLNAMPPTTPGLASYKRKYLLWYSIFSKLTRLPSPNDNHPDAYLGYIVRAIKEDHGLHISQLLSEKALKKTLQRFESPNFPEKNVLGNAVTLGNTTLLNYLIKGEFERDKQTLEKEKKKDMDEIAAIAHIDLEDWHQGKKIGKFRPVVSDHVAPDLKQPGTIRFYPLRG